MNMSISQRSFDQIRQYVHRIAGITIGEEKTMLVTSRLWRRLEITGCANYEDYLRLVQSPEGKEEQALMLDLLTTNETYFFREPAHFQRLANQILPQVRNRPAKVWCAACSTGEEAYSLAMVLSDQLGLSNWDLLATDISRKVLTHARRAHYRLERLEQMPKQYLRDYCLRGVHDHHGMMAIAPELRNRVRFEQHNLMENLKSGEMFDIIFLRNVLIYFDLPTKQKVVELLMQNLRPNGWLIIGHCESLMGLNLPVKQETPSVFRKLETPVSQLRIPA